MSTSVRVTFSPEEYRILDVVASAAGCTKVEFMRRLFFAWRDSRGFLLSRPERKEV